MRAYASRSPAGEQAVAGSIRGSTASSTPLRPVPADAITGWRTGAPLEPALAVGAAGGPLDPATAHSIAAAQRGGAPLDGATRSAMEGRLGTDLSGVRVHTGPTAAELCDRIQAKAFTVGPHVFFRDGYPDIARPDGRHLLAHELTHVAQQAASPAPVVQRSFLDGRHDWIDVSTHRKGFVGPEYERSDALVRIDTAVRGVRRAYEQGWHRVIRAELTMLRDAIALWRGPGDDRTPRMRRREVNQLEEQAIGLRQTLDAWEGGLYDQAMAAHADQQARVQGWLNEGSQHPTDVRLRNSCAWVLSGRLPFYVVTAAADAEHRGRVLLGRPLPPTQTVYFPNPDPALAGGRLIDGHPERNGYNRFSARDRTNVTVNGKINGWNRDNLVVVTDLATRPQDKDELFQTVRHEVQHQADLHRRPENNPELEAARQPDAPEGELAFQEALKLFKTEYRAHSYQGARRFRLDDRNRTTRQLGLDWTPKQWAVVSHLRRNYPEVRRAFGDGLFLTARQRRFRRDVNAYFNPDTEGFNKYNSLRIDQFHEALRQIAPGSALLTDPGVPELLQIVAGFEESDARYLLDDQESPKLRAKVAHHLAGAAKAAVNAELNRLAP